MVPRVFARSSTIFRYSQREFCSCLYCTYPTYCAPRTTQVYINFSFRVVPRRTTLKRIWMKFIVIMCNRNNINIYECVFHSIVVRIYEGAVFPHFNFIYSNTLILTKVTRNSRFLALLSISSCYLRVRLFPTSCGTVYCPTGGTPYRNVEISSTSGLATRGASLFASANGKGIRSRNSYFSRFPDVFHDRVGANKVFSISTGDRAVVRTQVAQEREVRCITPCTFTVKRSIRGERVLYRRRRGRCDLAMKRALRLIKLLKLGHYFSAGGTHSISVSRSSAPVSGNFVEKVASNIRNRDDRSGRKES